VGALGSAMPTDPSPEGSGPQGEACPYVCLVIELRKV